MKFSESPIRSISIADFSLQCIKIPKGEFQYEVDWKTMPHRNLAQKKHIEQHIITIKKDVWLGAGLVSQKIWQAVMKKNPATFRGADCPIESVSIQEIIVFLKHLSHTAQCLCRLPLETEYLAACHYSLDVETRADISNTTWNASNSNQKTHPVESKPLGNLGFSDLLGNVFQFLQPDITKTKYNEYVYRGASWNTMQQWLHEAYSIKIPFDFRDNSVGFRIAVL